jgi:hypothetical protein
MRAETGQALLASTPQLRPGGPRLSSLVGRIAESRGLTLVDSSPIPSTPVPSTPAPSTPAPSTDHATEPLATAALAAVALTPAAPPPAAPAPVAPVPSTSVSSTSATAVRRVDAPALWLPAAGLVTAPPASRFRAQSTLPVDGVALLGAHGGAGVTSLLRAGLDQVAVDADRRWPPAGPVLLVARTSTSGLEWARDLARQHASGSAGDVELLGLVLLPDAPGRLPARTAGLRDLVSGAFARTWQLPWLEEWRLAAATEPLPAHPDVQHLAAELARTAPLMHPDLSCTTPRTRGDLL